MSPENEFKYSYLVFDVYRLSRIFLTVSTILTLSGLYFSALPHYLEDGVYSNHTQHVMKTYKTFPNGSLYYDSVDEFGNVTYYELGDWFLRLLNGEPRYSYGNSFWNYCTQRIVPTTQWMTSVLRSEYHILPSQVLFRTGVLITFTFSIFQCLLLRYIHHNSFSGVFLLINEVIHNLSLFTITCLHSEQDAHLIKFTRWSLVSVTFTTVFKLIYSTLIYNRNRYIQLLCMLMSSIVILSHNTIIDDFDSFIATPYCDSMAETHVAIAQLSMIFALGICSYLQCCSLRGITCITSVSVEEFEYEKRFCAGG